jgi:hypothetical protein
MVYFNTMAYLLQISSPVDFLYIGFVDYPDEMKIEKVFHRASTDFNENSINVMKAEELNTLQLMSSR